MQISDFFAEYKIDTVSEATVEILLSPANGINIREFYTDLEKIYKANFLELHKKIGIIYNYTKSNCKSCSSQVLKYLQNLEKLENLNKIKPKKKIKADK